MSRTDTGAAEIRLRPLPGAGDVVLGDWLGRKAIVHAIGSLGLRDVDEAEWRSLTAASGTRLVARVRPADPGKLPVRLVPFRLVDGSPGVWRSVGDDFEIKPEPGGYRLCRITGSVAVPVGEFPEQTLGRAKALASELSTRTSCGARWSHLAERPGVSDYREVLVRLDGPNKARRPYRTPTWNETDVLFHLRLSERRIERRALAPARALHLDEIQSDWTEDGRRFGWAVDPAAEIARLDGRIAELMAAAGRDGLAIGLDRAIEPRASTPDPAPAVRFAHYFLLMCDESFHTGIHRSGTHVQQCRFADLRITDDLRASVMTSELPRLALRHRELVSARETVLKAVPPAPFTGSWLDLGLTVALAEAVRGGYDAVTTASIHRLRAPASRSTQRVR